MILSPEALPSIHHEHPDAGIALRWGCYDLLHKGHQEGIDFAASQADLLVVGVMPDEYITQTKGPDRPVNAAQDRVAAIDLAPGVDYSFIIPMGTVSPDGLARLVQALRPDVYIGRGSSMGRRMGQLGVRSVLDTAPKTCSTTAMLETLGRTAAIHSADLGYSPL